MWPRPVTYLPFSCIWSLRSKGRYSNATNEKDIRGGCGSGMTQPHIYTEYLAGSVSAEYKLLSVVGGLGDLTQSERSPDRIYGFHLLLITPFH